MKKQSDTLDTTENNENEMQDDEFFEHYLKNQTQLSKQYQQLETPEPSDKLNQAILSASKKQARKNHWWANPGSWAATIAVLSLAGLLTHNTWQNEQNRLQQDIEQQVFSSSRALPASEPKSEARTEAASVGTSEAEKQSATAVPVSSPASFPAKGSFLTDETKDSRKLTFKNAPAPIMSSSSESLRLHSADSDLKKEDISVIQSMSGLKAGEAFNDIPEKKRTLTPSTQQHSETALLPLEWLEKIKYLLQQGRLEEAQKLLYEFQRKYPDYPVDPVILQQLPHTRCVLLKLKSGIMKEHKPIEINLHKKSHLLEITFDTGENFKLSCEYLRTHAKSAEVKTATVPIAEKINVNKEFAELFTVLEHGDEITLIPKTK